MRFRLVCNNYLVQNTETDVTVSITYLIEIKFVLKTEINKP